MTNHRESESPPPPTSEPTPKPDTWFRLTLTTRDERSVVFWSAACFFCLLASWYMIRPVREAMGLTGGVRDLEWLFYGTMGVMLVANPIFAAIVSVIPRRRVVPGVFIFFGLNLAVFWLLFRTDRPSDLGLARAFYIWASVFNLFVLSAFWSLMADLFTTDQAKRVFGFVGVGGTLGAIVGAAAASFLATRIGEVNLIGLSLLALAAAAVCAAQMMRRAGDRTVTHREPDAPTRGRAIDGMVHVARSPYLIGVSLFLLCLTLGSTVVYFAQAELVDTMFETREQRTRIFALIDLWTNVATVIIQLLFTGRIIRAIGVGPTLALLPLVTLLGFLGFALAPVLITLVIFQIVRRTSNYALSKPARESLFTVLSPEDRYKAKNFIDTFVYRGGDVIGARGFALLTDGPMHLGLSAVSWLCVPVMGAWIVLALWLGRAQSARATRGG